MDWILLLTLSGIGIFVISPVVVIIATVIEEEKKRKAEEENLREVEGYPRKRRKKC